MTDRPVNLRLGVRPDASGLTGQSGDAKSDTPAQGDVDAQLRRRFVQAFSSVADQSETADQPHERHAVPFASQLSTLDAPQSKPPRSPFELFSREEVPAGTSQACASPNKVTPSESNVPMQSMQSSSSPWAAVSELIDQMLISDGGNGRRCVTVSLADESLPQVHASIYESAGAWIADFECGLETSYRRLAEPAHTMAERMAAELGRHAAWQVRAPGLGLPDVVAHGEPDRLSVGERVPDHPEGTR